MKKLLIISDPLEKFRIKGDTTYLLMLTAHQLGFEIYQCLPGDLFSISNQAYATVNQIAIAHKLDQIHSTQSWYSIAATFNNHALTNFDVISVRNDPPFDMEYYYLTQILELAEASGVKVINPAATLRNFNEKLAILNFPDIITPTLVSKNKAVIDQFITTHGVCVAKPIDMMAGRGVFRISNDDPNQAAILENLTDYYSQTIMVQKFIPEVVAGDKRIFIINGQIVDFCLYRIPQGGQIRGNLAVGGRGEVHPLNEDDYNIARQVAKWLLPNGIIFAGIDVIGKCLTEVNITSPTGAQQIYQETGINVTQLLLEPFS
jgi:glutathione synthase